MYLFAAQDKKPAYYRLINGNIPDVSSMSLCVKEIGVQNVVFIADKGFYRAANVQALDNAGLHSIIPLHRNNALIDYEPLDAADFKKRANFLCIRSGLSGAMNTSGRGNISRPTLTSGCGWRKRRITFSG
jgi:hypothetical protein